MKRNQETVLSIDGQQLNAARHILLSIATIAGSEARDRIEACGNLAQIRNLATSAAKTILLPPANAGTAIDTADCAAMESKRAELMAKIIRAASPHARKVTVRTVLLVEIERPRICLATAIRAIDSVLKDENTAWLNEAESMEISARRLLRVACDQAVRYENEY
jgi:hypothetical protein